MELGECNGTKEKNKGGTRAHNMKYSAGKGLVRQWPMMTVISKSTGVGL